MHGIHQQVGSMCSRMPQALGGDSGRLRFREFFLERHTPGTHGRASDWAIVEGGRISGTCGVRRSDADMFPALRGFWLLMCPTRVGPSDPRKVKSG